jgi:DNA polymerase zeta
MVKRALKKAKNQKSLQKMLDARQFALKMMLNVTYGYTSASFSGYFPFLIKNKNNTKTKNEKKTKKSLQKMLDARQFALKMMLNVTYGYTSASFSGYIPFPLHLKQKTQKTKNNEKKACRKCLTQGNSLSK